MKYDITTKEAPIMPNLGSGCECIRLLASQVAPEMRQQVVPMLFPALATYMSGCEFLYPDNSYKEITGLLAHLVADSGTGKGQLTGCVEAIMERYRKHDEEELEKLVEWQRTVKTRGANKEKPQRPNIALWYPPSDVTSPAFIQNAMACEELGGHTQFYNMPEIEMADKMCGGHKQVSQTIRNIFDKARAGALRATADGVTGNPTLRVNISFSSTPFSARKFYRNDLYNGTFGRIMFCYKQRQQRSGKIPRQGFYNEDFANRLDSFLVRLEACKGRFVIPRLNKLADRLAEDMATLADLTDDDTMWDFSKRSIVTAWKCGCLLYVANGLQWTKCMADLVEWLVYHDLWSKSQVFADLLKENETAAGVQRSGPKNMLDDLPNTFTLQQLEALRLSMGKEKDGYNNLRVWTYRGFITYDEQTQLYSKTQDYLLGTNTRRR